MKQNPILSRREEQAAYLGRTPSKAAEVNNKGINQIRMRAKTHQNVGGSQLNKTLPPALIHKTSVEEDKMHHPDIYHKPETRKKYFCDLVDSYMNKKASDNNATPKRRVHHKISIINRYEIVPEEDNIELNSPQIPVKLFKVKRALTAGFSRRVATQTTDLKPTNSKDAEYDFPIKGSLTDKKQQQLQFSRGSGFSNSRQINSKPISKLQMMKSYLRSSKNTKNYERRQEMIVERKNTRLNSQIDPSKSISSHTNSQNLDDESVNDELIETSAFPYSIQKGEKQNEGIAKSRLKTMSKISGSRNAFSSKSKSTTKLVDAKELADFKIDAADLQKDINKRIKLIKTKFMQTQWSITYMHEHALYQVFYLSPMEQVNSPQQSDSKPKPSLKIKKFKQTPQAQKIMNTTEKTKQIKVSQLWTSLPKIGQSSSNLYFSPNQKSLRQQLFQFMKQEKNSEETLYHIQLTPSYFKLFHNNCEYFRDIIVAVASDLSKMKGTLINNRISLDNLYRLEEKMIQVGDWGCAAINRRLMVAGKEVVFRDEPLLMIQQIQFDQEQNVRTKWLVSPEHLPPEIIQCLISGVYSRIWEIEECPEIWSLGIMIYELLNCIPVSMPHLSTINHKIAKRGLFYDKQKRLTQILSNQSKMPTLVSKWIRDEKNSPIYKHIHPQILTLMKAMLQLNPKCRPSPEHIVSRLRNTI